MSTQAAPRTAADLGATTDTAAPSIREKTRGRALDRIGLVIAVLSIAGLCAAPFFVYPVFIMSVLCFALFATAFNLLLGYTGLLSFGHAAFFGGAAYFTAHAAKIWGWEPLSAILLGTLGAGLMGLAVGFLAIRRQGIYFAMVTLALSQMIFFIFLQVPFTHGEDGIQGVPRGHLLGLINLNDPLNIYYFVLAIFLVGFYAVWRIVHSPFGHILKAIRENENRAISLGYRVERYKLGAFVMSAAIAGLAGSTKAIVFQIATLTDVGLADVRRGRPDDAARRHGHDLRSLDRRDPGGHPAELFRHVRLPGHRHHRRHLRHLRPPLPPRHRRRGDKTDPAIGRRPDFGGSAPGTGFRRLVNFLRDGAGGGSRGERTALSHSPSRLVQPPKRTERKNEASHPVPRACGSAREVDQFR